MFSLANEDGHATSVLWMCKYSPCHLVAWLWGLHSQIFPNEDVSVMSLLLLSWQHERRAFPLQVYSCSLTFPGYTTLTTTQYTVPETAEPIHADNAQMLGLDSSASHQWHMVHSRRRLSSLQPFSTPTTAFSPKTKPRINYLSKLNAESYFLLSVWTCFEWPRSRLNQVASFTRLAIDTQTYARSLPRAPLFPVVPCIVSGYLNMHNESCDSSSTRKSFWSVEPKIRTSYRFFEQNVKFFW